MTTNIHKNAWVKTKMRGLKNNQQNNAWINVFTPSRPIPLFLFIFFNIKEKEKE